MATEKRLIDVNADNCGEATKIKTHYARIVVDGTAEKPYYSIEWYDPTKKEYFLGYSSYYIGNVFNWLSECFEIVAPPTVDAVEVVHGYNIDRDTPSLFECSVCHWSCWDTYCGDTDDYNYCPNCGAKMDGDRNGL